VTVRCCASAKSSVSDLSHDAAALVVVEDDGMVIDSYDSCDLRCIAVMLFCSSNLLQRVPGRFYRNKETRQKRPPRTGQVHLPSYSRRPKVRDANNDI